VEKELARRTMTAARGEIPFSLCHLPSVERARPFMQTSSYYTLVITLSPVCQLRDAGTAGPLMLHSFYGNLSHICQGKPRVSISTFSLVDTPTFVGYPEPNLRNGRHTPRRDRGDTSLP
jgi:hypothetical protein